MIHIKYEMNTTFYKKLHENCEENQKFYWLLERSKFSRSFLARKGKEADQIFQSEIKKKTDNKLEMVNQVNNKPDNDMPTEQKYASCTL